MSAPAATPPRPAAPAPAATAVPVLDSPGSSRQQRRRDAAAASVAAVLNRATASTLQFAQTLRRPTEVVRRAGGAMTLLPLLLSLIAILFAASAVRQVSLTSSSAASSRDLSRALRQRLAGLARGGQKSVTLDIAELDRLLALQHAEESDDVVTSAKLSGLGGEDDASADAGDGSPATSGDGDGDNAELEPLAALEPLTTATAPSAGDGEGPHSLAAEGAELPGLLVEKDGDVAWSGEDEESGGGGADGEAITDAPPPPDPAVGAQPVRPLVSSKPAAAAAPKSRAPPRGLTRAELVKRQLTRADQLVPRNRVDELPRKRRAAVPAGRVRKCDPGERFLHLLTAREGMSAWMHTLQEAIAAANALGRTFVEPCVAGGLLLPCTPGRVLPVPEGLADTDYPTTADDDPLAVPAFSEHCGASGGGDAAPLKPLAHDYGVAANITPIDGRSYPLALYLDLRTVRPLARRWISFDDWARCSFMDPATGRDELTDLRRSRGLVHAELAYCVSAGDGPVALSGKQDPSCSSAVGPYRFRRVWWPSNLAALRAAGNTTREHMATGYLPLLRADGRRDLFLFNAWRGFWARYGTLGGLRGGPGFNPIHAAAVRAWLSARLDVGGALRQGATDAAVGRKTGGGGDDADAAWDAYAVFQWRSETVDRELVEPCAKTLSAKAKAALARLRASLRVGGVLTADLPSPNNPCASWHVYTGSARENGARRKALASLGGAGLAKYDADHPGIDAGVLSIRDWILATGARWYVTCHSTSDPAACKGCFRSNSKYVGRILDFRAASRRPSVTNWFSLRPDGLLTQPARLPPPPPPDGGSKPAAKKR
jgi:hypothetical protein